MRLYHVKKLLHSKGSTKMNRQPREWKKIFTKLVSDEGLLSEYTRSSRNSVTASKIHEEMDKGQIIVLSEIRETKMIHVFSDL